MGNPPLNSLTTCSRCNSNSKWSAGGQLAPAALLLALVLQLRLAKMAKGSVFPDINTSCNHMDHFYNKKIAVLSSRQITKTCWPAGRQNGISHILMTTTALQNWSSGSLKQKRKVFWINKKKVTPSYWIHCLSIWTFYLWTFLYNIRPRLSSGD